MSSEQAPDPLGRGDECCRKEPYHFQALASPLCSEFGSEHHFSLPLGSVGKQSCLWSSLGHFKEAFVSCIKIV